MIKNKRRIFLVVLVLFCLFRIGSPLVEQLKHKRELSQKPSYEVYKTYIANRNVYHIYVMCNPEYPLSEIMVQKFSDDYFLSLKSKIDALEVSEIQTNIYMMMPSELPYGWEKSELDISCNFDTSVFYRQSVCVITVPYGADSFDDCKISFFEMN